MELVPKRITLIPSLLSCFDLATVARARSGIYSRGINRAYDRRHLAKRTLCTSSSNSSYISLKGVEEARRKGFSIEKESIAFQGWRDIVLREVKMPSGLLLTFDIVKSPSPMVLVFTWHTDTQTTTMIREYCPAQNSFDSCVIAGAVEDLKHESPCEAAAHELEEEAHLIGGQWIPLLNSPTGTDKYSESRLYAYLVIDPVETQNPKPRDVAEDDIEIEKGISLQEVRRRIRDSELNVISAYASMLAMESLQSLGYVK